MPASQLPTKTSGQQSPNRLRPCSREHEPTATTASQTLTKTSELPHARESQCALQADAGCRTTQRVVVVVTIDVVVVVVLVRVVVEVTVVVMEVSW